MQESAQFHPNTTFAEPTSQAASKNSPPDNNQTLPSRTIPTSNADIAPLSSDAKIPVTPEPTPKKKVLDLAKYDANSTAAFYVPGHSITAEDKCPYFGRDTTLLVVIASAPRNAKARNAIRQTWGAFDQRRDVSIFFLVGTTLDAAAEKVLEDEQDLYQDVIRANFQDAYTNLTLKTISMLEWVDTYCYEAKFLLKTDDDMFINVERLLDFIEKRKTTSNVIYGKVAKRWKPIRSKASKYYVSTQQYKKPVFPDFTTGPAYLMTRDVVHNLYEESLKRIYFMLEDVYITGMVAEKLRVRRQASSEFVNAKMSHAICSVKSVISIHMVSYEEQFNLWKNLHGTAKCNKHSG